MVEFNDKIWELLASTQPAGDNLTARPFESKLKNRIFFAIDSKKQRHFLISVLPDEAELWDVSSRGVSATTRELTFDSNNIVNYIDVVCLDKDGNEAFDLLCRDIIKSLTKQSEQPAILIKKIIWKWRKFWSNIPKNILSGEEVVGLFGELLFLLNWVTKYVNYAEAVKRWRGAFGSRHDFEWEGRAVEVKTTTSTRGHLHRINGIDQMEPPDGGKLYMFSVVVREEASAINSLPNMVNNLRNKFAEDFDALDKLDSALIQAGYLTSHEEDYREICFDIIEQKIYEVKENFPKLTISDFLNGLPSGIEKVEYEINLNGYDHLIVSSSPDDLATKDIFK
jgi:hypothetical protein